MTEFNYTRDITCPHCGHVHRDGYEWFTGGNETAEIECHGCEKEFLAVIHHDVKYSSRELQPARGVKG